LPTSKKDEAAEKFTPLDCVYAFPTTIRIDRKGKVRKIHMALSGSDTGDQFEEFKKEFTTSIEPLLTEI